MNTQSSIYKYLIVVIFLSFLYIPNFTFGQRIVFNVFGVRGASSTIAGREDWMEARSVNVPFRTGHQFDRNAKLDPKDFDRSANLFVINRLFDPTITQFLSAAKSGQAYREITVEYISLIRNEWKPITRYIFKDVVVQSVALNFSDNSAEGPYETIVFAYSSISHEFSLVDPKNGAVISTRKTKGIPETDARNN